MCLTGVVFVIFGFSKLLEGAWVVLVIIPTLVMVFRSIHRHYTDVAVQVEADTSTRPITVHATFIVRSPTSTASPSSPWRWQGPSPPP